MDRFLTLYRRQWFLLKEVNSLSRVWLFATPWTIAYQVPQSTEFSGKSAGVGTLLHFLLQGIFLTQGSNPGLLYCRQTLYHLSHQGSHLKEKEMQKAKWLSEEALQIAERREAKSKGKKERYSHLNAEFQRIARRHKKAFLSHQCKEIEENNRMGKTRDLFKKIRDIKGTFHAKMGSTKDRNGMDLTEAEDIKKRWQEYTEELYKKDLHDPDNHKGMITHLEPDILECEVKWALGSITMNKASGGDGIPVELFQILKDDAVKVLHSICQQIWKTQQWSQDWKRSIFIPISKKGNAKECSNYHTTALISHSSKVMLKILQARLKQYVNRELPDVQPGFRKAEEPETKLPTSAESSKKVRVPGKHLFLLYWLCQSVWLYGSQQTVENS